MQAQPAALYLKLSSTQGDFAGTGVHPGGQDLGQRWSAIWEGCPLYPAPFSPRHHSSMHGEVWMLSPP